MDLQAHKDALLCALKKLTVITQNVDRPWFNAVKCLARQSTVQHVTTNIAQRTFLITYATEFDEKMGDNGKPVTYHGRRALYLTLNNAAGFNDNVEFANILAGVCMTFDRDNDCWLLNPMQGNKCKDFPSITTVHQLNKLSKGSGTRMNVCVLHSQHHCCA